MKFLFIIPARGGSKGIPGKNLALVGGVPLVGRAVRSAIRARESMSLDARIVCSTDDEIIASAAREWGAEVPFIRPTELATDEAKSIDVVFHALDFLGMDSGSVILLQPTSPFVEQEDIIAALKIHLDQKKSVISVCSVDHPVEWECTIDKEGRIIAPDVTKISRRQDAQQRFRFNGALYLSDVSSLRKYRSFLTAETIAFVMPRERSLDIDTPLDLTMARLSVKQDRNSIISIGDRKIGPGHPCYIIAEAGVNHNGSLDMALKLVEAAAKAGADAIKFQTFKAEKVVSLSATKADYQKNSSSIDQTQFEMVKKLELSFDSFAQIHAYCKKRKIEFLSTPFDEESIDFLSDLGIAAFKVGSGDLTYTNHLHYLGSKGRPVLLSTGMANWLEIEDAVQTLRVAGIKDIAIFHCVSSYPTPPEDCHLNLIKEIAEKFSVPVGWSDHTVGIHISLAAVSLGACLIEKHFTLDSTMEGPDHAASIEPLELQQLVKQIRDIEKAMRHSEKKLQSSEENVAAVARRSLHTSHALPEGHTIKESDLMSLRPGTGIPPSRISSIVGRVTKRSIDANSILREEDLQ